MEDIVDITRIDSQREQFRRRLLRVVVPIGCVVLMMASILGIALYSYSNNRRDALALSEDLLQSLDRRIATEVRTFLSPASNMVRILDNTMKDPSYWENRRALAAPLAIQMLKAQPQLAIFSFGDTKGNYMMLKKMPDRSVHTKLIERGEDGIKATWIRRDPDGREIGREYTPDDTYDPRTRPWYIGAVDTPGVYWTDVYIFFTDRKPGITASKAFRDDNGELLGVVGVDIELENLSRFLGDLQIGRNGRAMIIDEAGRLVAFPDLDRMMKPKGGELLSVRLNELNDPVLDRAFNRFLIERQGHRELIVDGKKYINTVSSLQSTVDKNWSVMITVPADDFVGFVSRNNRKALLMSIGVLALASLLAGLLIWQGLRADRNARLLLARREEMETQSRAFSALASKPAVFDPDDTAALEDVTRITAEAVGVRRVSVWQWQFGGRQLVCDDCYDRESGGHTRGAVLLQEDLPQLFESLLAEEAIPVKDAAHDPRTAELHRVYLDSMGCNGILAIPIFDEVKARGALWFEEEDAERPWRPEEISFARAVSGLLALRLSAAQGRSVCAPVAGAQTEFETSQAGDAVAVGDRHKQKVSANGAKPIVHVEPAMRQTTIVDLRMQVFRNQMTQRTSSPEAIGADVFEDVTVMVLQFTDSLALAERIGGQRPSTAVDRLIYRLEELASASGIEYMKFVSDQLVCASGFRGDVIVDHPRMVAELALNFQDTCLGIFENSSTVLDFRIGIDTGAVIGSAVGREHQIYNLWGEAVRTAGRMAESGSTGEIHVSESTYRRLQSAYLFKVRGHYYLPNIGELTTYVLTGSL